MNDPLSVKVPKAVYDGIHRAWSSDPKDRLRYSISGTAAKCRQLGETAAAEWVEKHDYLYGVGVWGGFYVDSEYPGDVSVNEEPVSEIAVSQARKKGLPASPKLPVLTSGPGPRRTPRAEAARPNPRAYKAVPPLRRNKALPRG